MPSEISTSTRRSRRRCTAGAAGLAATALLAACNLTSVPTTNTKVAGMSRPDLLAREIEQVEVARGSMHLENGTAELPYYGYQGDGPMLPAPGDLPSPNHLVEATKTEPDKNVYLKLDGQRGADPAYDYGTHFLFQGHEGGTRGSITRINLDADVQHRVTLIGDRDVAGAPLPTYDGSTWDPWARRLLLTSEKAEKGGVWQSTLGPNAEVRDISGVTGRGGYEGIQNDGDGNVWIVEDVGGPKGKVNVNAKQPNSFVYRLVPTDPSDLTKGGRLQALQITSRSRPHAPIVFHAGQADADILSQDVADLHSYGRKFKTTWVTVHDTATDGFTPFDANAAAKLHNATPLKRPENGVFRPGTNFGEFFFTETGDTTNLTEAGAEHGGYGAIFRLKQKRASADSGTLTMFYRGDQAHTGLDNISFATDHQVFAAEDAGDTLHTQRNAFDSLYLFDTDTKYGVKGRATEPTRAIAQGRDPSATIDSGFTGRDGFQNDGDNELTGIHVSDGDPTVRGVLGTRTPAPPQNGWRVFYTRQHGDNVTFELRAR